MEENIQRTGEGVGLGTHSTQSRTLASPVAGTDRIKTIDMIRGFALLGILLMNIPGFGVDDSMYKDILKSTERGKDYWTLATVTTFFEGSMRGLFSMLFGAGMILFTENKKDTPGGVTVGEYYYRRLLWLLLFGFFNAYILLWPGDILYFYALAGMVLFPFRKLSPRWLIIAGFVAIGIGIVKEAWNWSEAREARSNYKEAKASEKKEEKLTEEQQSAIMKWDAIERDGITDTARINEGIRKMRSGYGTVFMHLMPVNSNAEIWGAYHGIWDALCMMFIGMALFKLGLFSNKFRTSGYLMIALVGYGIGVPLGWLTFKGGYETYFGNGLTAFVDMWRVNPFAAIDFKRLFLALGHTGLIMLVYRSRMVPWLMRALANVGQMAFTNYLMQSLICSFFFYGYGFNNYHRLGFHQLYYVVVCIWIFQLIFSSIWLRFFRFGPFEWLWRTLTYWQWQPMKK